MAYGPDDFEQDEILEESIYDEVERCYGDDLAELAQNADWS